MKSFSILLSLACIAIATPLSNGESDQAPFNAELMTSYPGFTLDLNAQRLVQIEGQKPVWMTELAKVYSGCLVPLSIVDRLIFAQIRAKAQGIKFFDM